MFRNPYKAAITLRDGVLISQQATRTILLPLAGQPMTLVIERTDRGAIDLVAQRGEHHQVLASYPTEKQARAILEQLTGQRGFSIPTASSVVLGGIGVMFIAWFLFVLPSSPTEAPAISAFNRMMPDAVAATKRPDLPARGADPALLRQPSTSHRASATQPLIQPVIAQPKAAQPNPFGLQD